MRKEERLTKSSQFAAVFKHGNTWVNDLMVLRSMPNGLELSRFGFVVSKKVGGAVVRNRVRRLLRETARRVESRESRVESRESRVESRESRGGGLQSEASPERSVSRAKRLQNGWDIVIVARKKAAQAGYHSVEKALRVLLRRARLLE
ncbi:MAG: Ribonuclease P protein component [Dehalococcoidia bacterium]|nr:Ribonuclease P protein component [Chloroflexota bacterium]